MLWMSYSPRRGPHTGRPGGARQLRPLAPAAHAASTAATRPGAPCGDPHLALVQGLRFEPLLQFQVGLDERFCVEVDSRRRAPLYVVGGGDAWLQVGDEAPVRLAHGDVVFLPRGGPHRVFSAPESPVVTLDALLLNPPLAAHAALPESGGNVWSGGFYWSHELAAHPLLAALPAVLHLRAADATDWLPPLANALRWMSDARTGGRGVGVGELLTALLQHVVLDWLRRAERAVPADAASEAAGRDGRLLAALEAIHARPEQPWTVDALAALCHMSRTAFATRFRAQMQLAPMQYLARWRLHLAARLLREGRMPLQQAADAVGYSTGAILARAYKRAFGTAPSLSP